MTDLRDKIAAVIAGCYMQNDTVRDIADAIITALPGMVAPLVWSELQQDRGDGCADDTGDYESGSYLIEMGFGSDAYCWAVSFSGDFVSSHDDPDTAKAAANVRHAAAVVAEFTGVRA